MQIDLANWFEIIAALTAVVCCIFKPQRITIVLAILLVATVAVEFSSKYLSAQHRITHNLLYIHVKLAMYALLYNSLSFCGSLAIIYLLINDKKNKNQYIYAGAIMILFTILNFLFGQGYKTYNNYSTAFSWFLLVAFTLYKLRTYPEHLLSRHRNFIVLLFVLTIIFYYSINMPFFVFFQQMFAKDRSAGVTLYRVINDGANYPLYIILALIAVLLSTKESETNVSAT